MKSKEFSPDLNENKTEITSDSNQKNEEEIKNIKQDVPIQINTNTIIVPFNWNGFDAFCLMILIFFGVFCRFWIIQYPRHMVYKEDNQIHVINSYLNGSLFIDTEPPFASMIMAGVSYLADYNITYTLPRKEFNYSYHDMQYVALRTTPAFFSTITIPLSFFIVRSFGGSRYAAFSAGLFVMFDFLLISLGRHIFTDGIIQFLVSFTIFLISISTHFNEESTSFIVIILFESIFTGFSISSSVSAIGLWIFVIIYNVTYNKKFHINALLLNLFIPIIIFVFCFAYQVTLMPYHSSYDLILSDDFKAYLFNPGQKVDIHHSTILERAFELIHAMFYLRKKETNHAQIPLINSPPSNVNNNKWYLWPFMATKWVVLWTQKERYVSCFGNIATWWPICIGILLCLLKFFLVGKINSKSQILCLGYLTSLVTFIFYPSLRGLCDYEISLIFGLLFLPLFIEEEFSEECNGFLFTALIFVSGFIFILWAPLVYGYENFDMRFFPYFAK